LPTGYSASYLTALFFASGVNLFVSRRKRRPFSVAGPTAWNGLQVALDKFLFRRAISISQIKNNINYNYNTHYL